jgi:hypothetical protein
MQKYKDKDKEKDKDVGRSVGKKIKTKSAGYSGCDCHTCLRQARND